jgi:hypothetical protein
MEESQPLKPQNPPYRNALVAAAFRARSRASAAFEACDIPPSSVPPQWPGFVIRA